MRFCTQQSRKENPPASTGTSVYSPQTSAASTPRSSPQKDISSPRMAVTAAASDGSPAVRAENLPSAAARTISSCPSLALTPRASASARMVLPSSRRTCVSGCLMM